MAIDEFRVDIDAAMSPNYCGDAHEFVESCIEDGRMWQTIILDPPYNLRKSREKYEGRYVGKYHKTKLLLPQILKIGGRLIHLGYDTVGMGGSRGFEKIAICLVCHGGDHNDTICLVERLNCEQKALL